MFDSTGNASTLLKAYCSDTQVISVRDSTVSEHHDYDNCTLEEILKTNYHKCCQEMSPDCSFNHSFPLNGDETINEKCNGRQECSSQVSQVDTSHHCSGSDFSQRNTHYLHFNYFCIEGKFGNFFSVLVFK